jgi:hypothetical protein
MARKSQPTFSIDHDLASSTTVSAAIIVTDLGPDNNRSPRLFSLGVHRCCVAVSGLDQIHRHVFLGLAPQGMYRRPVGAWDEFRDTLLDQGFLIETWHKARV